MYNCILIKRWSKLRILHIILTKNCYNTIRKLLVILDYCLPTINMQKLKMSVTICWYISEIVLSKLSVQIVKILWIKYVLNAIFLEQYHYLSQQQNTKLSVLFYIIYHEHKICHQYLTSKFTEILEFFFLDFIF